MQQEGLVFLSHLEKEDLDWFFDTGVEQQIIANTAIIREDEHPDSIFFVLEGLLGVHLSSLEEQRITQIGPGAIVGEISFLRGTPATATVTAIENSLLLAVSRNALQKRIDTDDKFAANFFRALAFETTHRLQKSVNTVSKLYSDKAETEAVGGETWDILSKDLHDFKELIRQADAEALKNDSVVPEDYVQIIRNGFNAFSRKLNEMIGDAAPGNAAVKEELGRRVQREMLPYMLLTTLAERMYSKPRGYAGDFYTIELMYRGVAGDGHRLGAVLDECFINEPAAVAVRNRRGLLAEEIHRCLNENGAEVTKVTSMASGPAAELFDVYSEIEDITRLKSTLIDIDLQALAFVGDKRDKKKLTRQMEMINGNLVYLATGRQKVFLKDQDLVYSIGLIDYFNDKFVTMLLNYVYELLKPGGKVILGNFHTSNPTKALMDHVLDWRLIHRDETDMNRLFENSKFAKGCTEIRYESAGVNLFAMCTK